MPPTPNGPYSASPARAVIARLTPETTLGTQGRCRLKKVRVKIRKRPFSGSEKAYQKSA